MATKRHHYVLWAAGLAVGGWAAYEYLYKPWQATQLAATAALPAALPNYSDYAAPSGLPSATDMLTDPNVLAPIIPSQVSASATGVTTSLGPQYGGVLGACIAKKGGTWSPSQCQTRLDQLVAGYQSAAQTIAQLQGSAANNNIASLQQLLAANQTALAQAQASYVAAQSNGDAASMATLATAIAGHQSDINAIQAKISANPGNADNSGTIAAYQGQMAANNMDYFNLTGTYLG
jgi:hypothetical protein